MNKEIHNTTKRKKMSAHLLNGLIALLFIIVCLSIVQPRITSMIGTRVFAVITIIQSYITDSLTVFDIQSSVDKKITAVSTSSSQGCALTTDQDLYCAGYNAYGTLGDGTVSGSYTPVKFLLPTGKSVSMLNSGVVSFSYINDTCLLTNDQEVYCSPRGTSAAAPSLVTLPSGIYATNLIGSNTLTCVTTNTREAFCRGDNTAGQLGDGTFTSSMSFVKYIVPSGTYIKKIVPSDKFYSFSFGNIFAMTCATTLKAEVYCAGSNRTQQLPGGNNISYTTPQKVALATGVYAQDVTAGPFHSCILSTAGEVYCIGGNQRGEFGNGNTTGGATPAKFNLPAGAYASKVMIGDSDSAQGGTCVLTTTKDVYCAGSNDYGQFGNGATSFSVTTPTIYQLPSGQKAQDIGSMYKHVCVLSTIGNVYCAGQNNFGQLGNGTTTDKSSPSLFLLPSTDNQAKALSVTPTSVCVSTVKLNIYCAGYNSYGQLADGTTTNQSTPVRFTIP